MSRTLIAHLGHHSLTELTAVASDRDRGTELQVAALAQIAFKIRLKPGTHRMRVREVLDTLEAIRTVEPRPRANLPWYVREARDATVDEIEAFLRELR